MRCQQPLILASSSATRRVLLNRLLLPFDCQSPDIDEQALENEQPDELTRRLARQKAEKIAAIKPMAVIIGSDQVAVVDGQILGKPGDMDRARSQLQMMSGKTVRFVSGTAVLNPERQTCRLESVRTEVVLRPLDDHEIERYLRLETPLDCAGSLKSECLGISLAERISSDDPTALMGLPLIGLSRMLREEGYTVP